MSTRPDVELERLAEHYIEYEMGSDVGLRDEIFACWCLGWPELTSDDREAVRLILLGRGVKVRRAA